MADDEERPGREVNHASVPHRSPFRYPGGKTWMVPRVRRWLGGLPRRPALLVEPFAGGGIVGLSALFEGLVREVLLVEKDDGVAAVWQAIVDGWAPELAARVMAFTVTEDNVRAALAAAPWDTPDRAFQTILRNRMQRGGIMAPGASLMKRGEKDRGLKSRWYPETLRRRLLDLHELRDRLRCRHDDGMAYLWENGWRKSVAWFIDPPYAAAGRRLYSHHEVDHHELFRLASRLSGPFLMTYDDSPLVLDLAGEFGFDTRAVAMRSTHNTVTWELLVGRDLGWCDG